MALSIDNNDDFKENQMIIITITLTCIHTNLTSMGQWGRVNTNTILQYIMIMMIITCYNHNYIKKIQLQLHYNHVQMTRNHMALSIDDNDDLKENQHLQLES